MKIKMKKKKGRLKKKPHLLARGKDEDEVSGSKKGEKKLKANESKDLLQFL